MSLYESSDSVFVFFFLILSVASTLTEANHTTNAINQFSLEFYKAASIKSPDKNLIVSPLSIEIILGLMSIGARGDTQKEINDALHLPDSETLISTFQSTTSRLKTIQEVVLNIANKVYVKDGAAFELTPAFKSVAVDNFSSDVENIDFSNNERAARTINEWVKIKTNNKIKDIVSSNALNSDTRVVLLNAIYFQGNWRFPFDKSRVQKRKFNKNKIEQIDVDMMFKSDYFPYADLPEWDANILSLPYRDIDTYLAIILPYKIDGLAALEANIYGANITDVLQRMQRAHINLMIPKFKIETTIDLSNILPELGIKLLFDDQKADLYHLLKSHEQISVSDAKQKAFIEVDEQGTKAAAITGISVAPNSAVQEISFEADRPFFYMLINKYDIIFCGKYIGA
ncbi:antichymotrypsin-2-like [Arctopsyche grandis]|uniref:antichymotrypsin-2-like n=1 Tax=Arctopsyche grandis TaxID=121162 RepID=UPI00406D80DF